MKSPFYYLSIRFNLLKKFAILALVLLPLFYFLSVSKSSHRKIWLPPSTSNYHGCLNLEELFQFDDPTTYKGPTIIGWEPDKDRNVTSYLYPHDSRNILINPFDTLEAKQPIELIMIQHSAPGRLENRMSNRMTWMTYTQRIPEIKVLFVIGLPVIWSDEKPAIDLNLQKKIEKEAEIFQDILQVGSYDSYHNNTMKSLFTLKFILGLDWAQITTSGNPPKFYSKSDDDVYFNLPLIKEVFLQNSTGLILPSPEKIPIMGGELCTHTVPKPNMSAPHVSNAYEVPPYIINDDRFPCFIQGSGYFMPWKVLPCLYQQAIQIPYFFLEDIVFAGYLPKRCCWPLKNVQGFNCLPPNKPIDAVNRSEDILIHYVNTDYKVKVHQHLLTSEIDKL